MLPFSFFIKTFENESGTESMLRPNEIVLYRKVVIDGLRLRGGWHSGPTLTDGAAQSFLNRNKGRNRIVIDAINLPVILSAALIATGSPGPATLAIAGTSMQQGRKYGLALAAGVTTGSLMWSIAAALGLATLMLANAWAFEVLRYFGAAYLLFLACKSAKSALTPGPALRTVSPVASLGRAYSKGLALHLTNPKAIFFFGSLYAIGVPAGSSATVLASVIAAIGVQSFFVFHGYALLFSSVRIARGYGRLRRWFEGAFALAFGAAGLKVLTT